MIYLDLPTVTCLRRVVRRAFQQALGETESLPIKVRGERRPAGRLWLSLRFLWFVATFRRRVRPLLLAELRQLPAERVWILRASDALVRRRPLQSGSEALAP